MRRLRVVARLQCRWLMRVTMLPPPPSFRIAAWARLNAIWFGVVDVLVRRLGPAVRAVRGGAALLGPGPASQCPASPTVTAPWRVTRATAVTTWAPHQGRRAPPDDRPTAVEVRGAADLETRPSMTG